MNGPLSPLSKRFGNRERAKRPCKKVERHSRREGARENITATALRSTAAGEKVWLGLSSYQKMGLGEDFLPNIDHRVQPFLATAVPTFCFIEPRPAAQKGTDNPLCEEDEDLTVALVLEVKPATISNFSEI